MDEPRVLRPLEYGEIFNEAFDLYKRNVPLFAGIGAVIYVPYAVLSALTANTPALRVLVAIAFYLPLVAANGAIIKALADRYLGRTASISGSWRYALRRLVPYLATSMRAGVMLFIGFLLLVVPGFIVAFWIFFLWNVMIVEDRYYRDAIQRSRQLAAGQWLRILVIVVLSLILYVAAYFVVGVIFAMAAPVISPATAAPGPGSTSLTGALLAELLGAALQTVLIPFTSVLSVLLYFDTRVRKEGFDIELLAQEMGELPPSGGPFTTRA